MRRAIITGATGYIGFHLSRRLAHDGWRVHAVTRESGRTDRLSEITGVSTHPTQFDAPSLRALFAEVRPAVVFHLAADARPSSFDDNLESNFNLGARLLEAAAHSPGANGPPAFIFAGSYWEFSKEGDYRPNSIYAALKHAFRQLLVFYHRAFGMGVATLTLFDVYGEADWRNKLFQQVLRAHGTGSRLEIGRSDREIDWIHVGDVTRAFALTGRHLLDAPDPMNLEHTVGTGRRLNLSQTIATFEATLGSKLPIDWIDPRTRPDATLMGLSDGAALAADRPPVGWTAEITLEDGLRRLIRARDEGL